MKTTCPVPGPRRSARLLQFFLFSYFLVATLAFSTEPLRVGLAGREPFAVGGKVPGGVVVDIWEKIAANNNWTFDFSSFSSIEEGLNAVADGRIDILAGSTPIKRSELAHVEFSQPYFRSGLQILVPDKQPTSELRLLGNLEELLHLEIFWIVTAGVVGLTIFVYWFEKKHNPDFPQGRKDGIAEAFYYVLTLALTGKSDYKGFSGVLGRFVMIVWILLGIITVAYVTSSITSAMTVEKLKGRIAGPQDLPGKTVVVVSNSDAEQALAQKGITLHKAPTFEDAVAALLAGKADALVDDVALVQTLDFKKPEVPVSTVGPVFSKVYFGFAFAIGNPLRLPFNRSLLQISENGDLAQILATYFGPDRQY